MLDGSPQAALLRAGSLDNLVPMPGRAEALAALRRRDVSACFGPLAPLRAHLGRQAGFGRAILTEPAWLALHPATADLPTPDLRAAHAALQADGSLARLLRPHLGAA